MARDPQQASGTAPADLMSSNGVAFFVDRLTDVANTKLPIFLDYVAKGNQAEVEKILEEYGALLLFNTLSLKEQLCRLP